MDKQAPGRTRHPALLCIIWLCALLLSMALDRPMARWVHERGIADAIRGHWIADQIVKRPGEYRFTLIVAAVVWFCDPRRWYAAGFVSLSGVIGLVNSLI